MAFCRVNAGVYLLGGSADEGLGVQDGVQMSQDGAEVGVGLDAGQQVVVSALLLHHGGRLLRQHADLLVAVLTHGRKWSTVRRKRLYQRYSL